MTRLLLMGDVVLRCQRRADMENDTTISIPEWQALISEQYAHLYGIVVKAGMRYFESTSTITADGSTSYTLPVDHDETIGIDRTVDSSGRKVELDELMVQERNAFSGQTGDALCYALSGQTIVFYPRPLTGTYTHVYVAQSPDISAISDETTFDVVTGDGEAFLVWGVTVKAQAKRDKDTTLAIQERNAAEVRFNEDCCLRALINPRRRVIVRGPNDPGWGGGYGNQIDDPGGWWSR